jgi:hypothetical protein
MENRTEAHLLSQEYFSTLTKTAALASHIILQQRFLISAVLSYLFIVRLLRYRREDESFKEFPSRASLSKMTFQQAEKIQNRLSQLEFPFTFEKALQFALFRTYGIPTISKLLVHTSQFSAQSTASKRYADTAVLIAEFLTQPWGSTRWLEGISRMNCIHLEYQKAGKISNDDMLYTLAMFAGEPYKWIARYEWRELSTVEKCAVGTWWKGVGEAMNIEFKGLPGHDSGRGWKDGMEWLEELMVWTESYEAGVMLPDDKSAQVAEQTVAILLWTLPSSMKPFGRNVVSSLMDDRLRAAMKIAPSPSWLISSKDILFAIRRILLRHFSLPRFIPLINVSLEPSKQGTFFLTKYDAMPYYVKPTLLNRWGPASWSSRILGLPLPGDEGAKYYPGGYKTTDVGPKIGYKQFPDMVAKVGETGKRSCPFAIG